MSLARDVGVGSVVVRSGKVPRELGMGFVCCVVICVSLTALI